jgi:hypothetical protein
MGSQKQRERRQVVFLSARLRTDDGWSDITICNVSSRGLMAKSSAPPAKGAFVEVRRGASCIVGHVRWTQGSRFGLRSQERIDADALSEDSGPRTRTRGNDRRATPRSSIPTPPPTPPAASEEKSRIFARLFDWITLAVAGIGAAAMIAQAASSVLSAPLQQTRTALATPRP